MIKVLWIDDIPNDDFMTRAEAFDLYIENKENVDDGISKLLNSSTSYDAIILDANCISHNDGTTETSVSALGYALKRITEEKIRAPWFVYSGGGFSGEESIDVLVSAYERPYDDRSWYRKPKQMTELFNKIREVVSDIETYKAKQEYPQIFGWYENQKEFVQILSFLKYENRNNPDVLNKIRKELDWLMEYFNKSGVLLVPFSGSNLSECSKAMGAEILSKEDIVPLYVQRALHKLCSVCNEGSHRLITDRLIRTGKASFLNRSLVIDFLNVLYWAKDLTITETDILSRKTRVQQLLETPDSDMNSSDEDMAAYEGLVGIVKQDSKGNYYIDKCRLPYGEAGYFLGKQVMIKDIAPNTAKSRDNYPYYAKRICKQP